MLAVLTEGAIPKTCGMQPKNVSFQDADVSWALFPNTFLKTHKKNN